MLIGGNTMQQPPNPYSQFQQPYNAPTSPYAPPPPYNYPPPRRPSGIGHWFRTRSRNTKIGLGCGTIIAALLLCICAASAYGSSTVATTLTPTPTTGHVTILNPPTVNITTDTPTLAPTQAPTTVTKVLVHPDSSIQDAAQGWSHGIAKSGVRASIVWVTDSSQWNADMIKLDCFNIQQAIWYGLKSTINADGSTTIIKSDFLEVDITFLANGSSVASCHLTSQTVEKIAKAGMWDDGDYVGAWTLYDSVSIQ